MTKKGTSGNQGPEIRSDCYTALEIKKSGGIKITLNSKVDALYKDSIQDLARQILDFYDIKNAELEIIDRGALPPILAARIESAVKMVLDAEQEFLLDIIPENQYQ